MSKNNKEQRNSKIGSKALYVFIISNNIRNYVVMLPNKTVFNFIKLLGYFSVIVVNSCFPVCPCLYCRNSLGFFLSCFRNDWLDNFIKKQRDLSKIPKGLCLLILDWSFFLFFLYAILKSIAVRN